jgi:hypothetical protein
MLQVEPFPLIASSVLLVESIILLILIMGWIYGARRLNFNLHHVAVYTIIVAHILTLSLWMLPIASGVMPFLLTNPLRFWRPLTHFILGSLALVFGMILGIIFLIKRDIPLNLLRRARPLMILTLSLWVLSFVLGFATYLAKYYGIG